MKKIVLTLVLVLLIAACAPPAAAPTEPPQQPPPEDTAVPPTNTLEPTPIPPTDTLEPTPTNTAVPPTLTPLPEGILFRDDFEGYLQPGWSWVNEDPERWSFAEFDNSWWLRIVGDDPGGLADEKKFPHAYSTGRRFCDNCPCSG